MFSTEVKNKHIYIKQVDGPDVPPRSVQRSVACLLTRLCSAVSWLHRCLDEDRKDGNEPFLIAHKEMCLKDDEKKRELLVKDAH